MLKCVWPLRRGVSAFTLQVASRPGLQIKSRTMADTPILLREQQYHQIKAVLARLRMDASAKVVFLVDKDGQEIASQGEVGNLDTTSLASLAAGNVAATGGMAQLIGEKEFPTLSPEGGEDSHYSHVRDWRAPAGNRLRRSLQPRPGQIAEQASLPPVGDDV